VDGAELGYCPGCGFAAYGDGARRGARVFEFGEAGPRDYQTRVVTYGELFGVKRLKRIRHRLTDWIPSSTADGISKGIKLLLALGVLAGAIIALVKLV
jgi:hypothetical protein